MSLENTSKSETKIAIVTGGSRGLGRNTVLSLAKRGVNSIFTYNSNQAEAEKVYRPAAAGRAQRQSPCSRIPATLPPSTSLRSRACAQHSRNSATRRFDYLVNNAKTSHHNAFEKT